MLAIIVPEGTNGKIIKAGAEWYANNFRDHSTSKDLMFFREDVVIDPFGNLATNKRHAKTIGGAYALAGYYGFERQGWILLVPAEHVTHA